MVRRSQGQDPGVLPGAQPCPAAATMEGAEMDGLHQAQAAANSDPGQPDVLAESCPAFGVPQVGNDLAASGDGQQLMRFCTPASPGSMQAAQHQLPSISNEHDSDAGLQTDGAPSSGYILLGHMACMNASALNDP